MTRFWQRRIAVMLMVGGTAAAVLYGLNFVVPASFALPQIGLYSGIAGIVAFLIGLLTFFATAPEEINQNGRLAYLTLVGLITTVVYSTGAIASPFVVFWGAVALAAPIFGSWGIITVVSIGLGVPAVQFFTKEIDLTAAWQAAALSVTPVLFGFFIKPVSNPKSADTQEDKSYHALAKKLSQVSGKSEVVINAIGEGVLALNGDGTIELINPAALKMVGWGNEDAVGLNYKSILKLSNSTGGEIDQAHDPVVRTFRTNDTTIDNSLSLITQSGKKLLVSIVASPIDQPGSGAIVVFRDITKDKLEERQQAEFISTASHEMRTPVASIEGYLGLALNSQIATVDEKAREYIHKAHEAAQHLGRLFQDLLDVSKADDNRMNSNPKIVDIVEFMSDLTEGLQPKAQAKGLNMIFKPRTNTIGSREKGIGRTLVPAFYVNVDNSHLREVMDNLVENAIKYTPAGQVAIDVTGDDDKVKVSIADTGIGIPREDVSHLFQKFYRVDSSETREIGGTGLGLYLCRKLVESMNGHIWVESEYQRGSTFFVELPRTSRVETTKLIQQAEAAAEANPVDIDPTPTPPQPTATITNPSPPAQTQPPASNSAVRSIFLTPTPQPLPTSRHYPNTPITTIEQNPRQYINQVQSRNINVPPRPQP